jgi:hypothetical protein
MEDAALVLSPSELERHPMYMEWQQELSALMHGQASSIAGERVNVGVDGTRYGLKSNKRGVPIQAAETAATMRVYRAARMRAQERRLAALRPVQTASDPIPF